MACAGVAPFVLAFVCLLSSGLAVRPAQVDEAEEALRPSQDEAQAEFEAGMHIRMDLSATYEDSGSSNHEGGKHTFYDDLEPGKNFYDDLEPVRADAVRALQNADITLGGVPKAVKDLCSSCQRVLRFRFTKCGKERCADPCAPGSFRNRFFGVNPFCPIVSGIVDGNSEVVDEHLEMLWNIQKNKKAYFETCTDMHMCGYLDNAILKVKLPEAQSFRDDVTLTVLSKYDDMQSVTGSDFRNLCAECQTHVDQPADDSECQMKHAVGSDMLECMPHDYCETKRTGRFLWDLLRPECVLSDDVRKQRNLSLQEIEAFDSRRRVVSPLLYKVGGATTTPWLHEWSKATSTSDACGVVALCGNDESALSRQFTFGSTISDRMIALTDFFRNEYTQLRFMKDLRAAWQATSKMTQMSNLLFEMRHSVSESLEAHIKTQTQQMIQAMLGSGFLDSVPEYLHPLLTDTMKSLNIGVPFGPRQFLENVAKSFALQWIFGKSHGATRAALKNYALLMQGKEESTFELDNSDKLPEVDDVLEVPIDDGDDPFDAATLFDDPASLAEHGVTLVSDAAFNSSRTAVVTQLKAAYTTIFSTCTSLAFYAKQNDYVVHCAAWPIVVARTLPKLVDAVKAMRDWRTHLGRWANASTAFLISPEFRAVLGKAIGPLINTTLETRDIKKGLLAGAEVLAAESMELVDFGELNATVKDPRVKAAVMEVVRDAVEEGWLGPNNFTQAVPMLIKKSTSKIGQAVFLVASEQFKGLGDTAKLLDALIQTIGAETRSSTQILADLLSAPDSPLLPLLAESAGSIVGLVLPDLEVDVEEWVLIFQRPDVREQLALSIDKLERPLSARKIAGQILGDPDLRKLLVHQVVAQMSPGADELLSAEELADTGMEALIGAALTFIK